MLATKSSVLAMVFLVSVCWIASVESICGGCTCNIFKCNCDCEIGARCDTHNYHGWCVAPYRRSISENETDPAIIFAKIDTNEVNISDFNFFLK